MNLTTQNGAQLEAGIAALFRRVQAHLNQKSGKVIAKGLSDAIRAHFRFQFPGSKHYDPSKVSPSNDSKLNEGVAEVDVPGASRAYHDIDIRPKIKQALTIPMHREAFGRSAADFNDLFVVKKKDGKAFLASNNGGNLTMMFFLAKNVHQRRDSKIMPSDSEMATVAMSRLSQLMSEIADKEIGNI